MRITLLTILLAASVTFGADWPQWRGPHLTGCSDEINLPASLEANMLLWKTPLPGNSAATPAIVSDSLYLASTEDGSDRLLALCVDASTGRIRWQKSPAVANQAFLRDNTMASCSPCADGSGAYFLFGEGTLVKLDPAGAVLWERNLVSDYGPLAIKFGYSTSPLLLDDKLYLPVLRYPKEKDVTGLDSYLLCVDAATGKTVFRQTRPSDAEDEFSNAYTSAVPATIDGRLQIIVYGGNAITGHDPLSGAELWRCSYIDTPNPAQWGRTIGTPIAADGMLYGAYPEGCKAFACDLKQLAAGQCGRVWTYDERVSDVPGPAMANGYLYYIAERPKTLHCIDAKTGAVQWTGQLDKSDTYYASVTAGDGKLYVVNRKGVVTIVAADPTAFRILSTRDLGESPTESTIAIANGKLYIRTAENLYCFGNK